MQQGSPPLTAALGGPQAVLPPVEINLSVCIDKIMPGVAETSHIGQPPEVRAP